MIDKLIVEAPLNNLSLGNVSYNFLRTLKQKGIKVLYCPIGNADLSSFNATDEFKVWIQAAAANFLKSYSRETPTVKIWHINGSHQFVSDKRYLCTFHECDQGTPEEINIIKNTDKTFFCGEYSKDVFSEYGLTNIDWFPLGFDEESFQKIEKKNYDDNRINWLLAGKAESRKNTFRLLKIWANKYGLQPGQSWVDNNRHFLNCAIANPFFHDENMKNYFQQQIHEALGGKRYYNIQFFDHLKTNKEYNALLNETHIDLTGMSSAESWNLPSFQITALGGRSIVLNATGHKSWTNDKNSILVNPVSKRPVYDNIFFNQGSPFSQGNVFDFNDEDLLLAMDKATQLAKIPNVEGEKLKDEFTYSKLVDNVLNAIKL